MSSATGGSLISSFLIYMSFISFSCHTALSKTSSIMFNGSGESTYTYFVPNLKGKALVFLAPLSIRFSCRFFCSFNKLTEFPCVPTFERFLS